MTRTRANLLTAIRSVGLFSNFLSGAGLTHCNQADRAILKALGLEIPPLLANDLADWFAGPEGIAAGWMPAEVSDAHWAAEKGNPVVGVYKNPNGHGHIVIGSPSPDTMSGASAGFHCCQAGLRNFECEPISHAFGAGATALPVSWFVHT